MTTPGFARRYQGRWTVQHGETPRDAIIAWDTDQHSYLVTLPQAGAKPFYLSVREMGQWLKGGKGRRVHR